MRVGDEVVVDGGMVRFVVTEKIGPDVMCRCIDPGLLLPRANLTLWRNGSLVQERNAMLPTISSKVGVKLPLRRCKCFFISCFQYFFPPSSFSSRIGWTLILGLQRVLILLQYLLSSLLK